MSEISWSGTDLLGDPVPENWGKRGRPPHIPTDRNRSKVRLLLGFGWTNRRIAQALRITVETLRRHYFLELRQRDEARPALEAERIMLVYGAARGGNVGAMKELGRLIDLDDPNRPQVPPQKREPKPKPLGKKAELEQAARAAPQGSGWERLVH